MLKIIWTDIKGREIVAPYPLSMSVSVDEGVPADSLDAEFPYIDTDELCEIMLYNDDQPVFRGIIDEEEKVVYQDGEYLRLSARSPAALLLDNEAMPCVYDHPSAGFIFERYVEPFGIRCDDLDDAVYFGEQTVAKGSSCWSVLKNFCNACYASVPRVSSTGVLHVKGLQEKEQICFGGDDMRYLRISELNKRSAELSAVRVKTANPGGYTLCVSNRDAQERGIRRERYLNALLSESPMRCADMMLRNGAGKAYSLKLRCLGCLLGTEGRKASVSDTVLGQRSGLYISSLYYRLTANGEYTDVRLKRRNSSCG